MESNFPQASRGDVAKRPLAFEPREAYLDRLSLLGEGLALRCGEYLAPLLLEASVALKQCDSPLGAATGGPVPFRQTKGPQRLARQHISS